MISPGHWGHRVSRWVAAAHSSLGPYVLVCPRASHVLLVNVQQPAFGRERTLIRSVRQFWWYKYFYHGLFQSANLHIFWKSNNWLLQAGTSTLWYKHILPRSQHTTVQCPTLPPNVVTWIKVTPASHTTLSSCALYASKLATTGADDPRIFPAATLEDSMTYRHTSQRTLSTLISGQSDIASLFLDLERAARRLKFLIWIQIWLYNLHHLILVLL